MSPGGRSRPGCPRSCVSGFCGSGDLIQAGWQAGGDGGDQGAHEASAVGLVGVLVGVDRLLVGAPGDLNDRVALVGEQASQPGLLALGEQAVPGQQCPAGLVQRVGCGAPAALPVVERGQVGAPSPRRRRRTSAHQQAR